MGITKTAQALKIIANGLVLHGFLCIVDFYTVQYGVGVYMPLSLLMCIIMAVCGELAKKKIENKVTLVGAALVIAMLSTVMVLFSILPVVLIVFGVAVFVWVLLYANDKLTKKIEYAPKSFVIMFIFMFAQGESFGLERLSMTATVEGIAFLILNIFLSGAFAHEKFIKENSSVQNFPMEHIRKTYFSLLMIFTMISGIGVLLISLLNIPTDFFKNILIGALRWIFNLFPKGNLQKTPEVPDEEYQSKDYYIDTSGFGDIDKAQLSESTDNILITISVALAVVVILAGIIWFIRRMIINLQQTRSIGSDSVEFAFANDTHEKARAEKSISENEANDKKIRKMYKKYVLKATKKNVDKSETPGILEQRIDGEEEKKKNIRAIYEKARYSNIPCSAEDAEMFKRSLK